MTHEFDGKKYEKASDHQKEWGTKLIAELGLQGTERVLDLGCGDGALTIQIAELVPDGEVVGHALLLPDPRWHNDIWLLDLFVHPDFCPAASGLLAAIELPPGRKVQAYADSQSPEKIQLLEGAGFHQEVVLRNQIVNTEGEHLDVHIFTTSD